MTRFDPLAVRRVVRLGPIVSLLLCVGVGCVNPSTVEETDSGSDHPQSATAGTLQTGGGGEGGGSGGTGGLGGIAGTGGEGAVAGAEAGAGTGGTDAPFDGEDAASGGTGGETGGTGGGLGGSGGNTGGAGGATGGTGGATGGAGGATGGTGGATGGTGGATGGTGGATGGAGGTTGGTGGATGGAGGTTGGTGGRTGGTGGATGGTGGATGGAGGATGGTGGATGGTGGATGGAGGATGGTGGRTGGTGGATGGTGGATGGTGGATGGTGGATGGTGGATGGTGGATGGTGGATGSCTNNRKDGNETGVDCGGSCSACPSYKIAAPNKNNNAQSGCQGGPGYMCVRSMLLSPEMKQAAYEDWGMDDPPFVYGTVGHDPDTGGIDSSSNTCCQCYQLIFESPTGATGLPIPKPMIVQAFNTAAGGGKNFDIYMAAGGYGANNGCVGGANPMYSQFPDMGGDYSGGVRATRYTQCASSGRYTAASVGSATCQDYVESQCLMIRSSASAVNQSTTQSSCMEANYVENHYHINWNVRAKRVECPVNLTRVTGCKLNNQGLPQANPNARDVATADSSFRTGYHTTTMQDCCRPTCAWTNNVTNADPTWSVFYTCDKAGNAQ